MTTTIDVIERIGDTGLLLPELIREALAANDRIKYFLTLLQTAALHAQQPFTPVPDLRAARESCGIADVAFDDAPARSSVTANGDLAIPGAARIQERIFEELRRMIEPLRAAAKTDADLRERYGQYHRRLDAHIEHASSCTEDGITPAALDDLTGAGDSGHDTAHRLVMELHRELNHLLADVALESVDGARAFGVDDEDRQLVAAFMNGVNSTAALKFDHPGLETTAARYGGRLSIQNDLGTTDGHLLVVQITGPKATIVYSDVHGPRVRFLQSLLRQFPIDWQTGLGGRGELQMIVGRFTATDRTALDEFVRCLGSRLVFLIDWNRARKRLARLVGKSSAVAVLDWAAAHNVGHRAFLQAGGLGLIYTAFERVAPARIRYGARLDELMGPEPASAFLRAVLRISTEGLQGGHSARLIQDKVEAELLPHLATTERGILDAASEHAMLLSALADRFQRTLARMPGTHARQDIERAAALAKTWESRADDLVRAACRAIADSATARLLRQLLTQADDVADAIEEAAFLLTLAVDAPGPTVAAIRPLGDLAAEAVREYVRCLEYAAERSAMQSRADVEDALVSVDRIAQLEHACDAAERAARVSLVGVSSAGEGQVVTEIARQLEQAVDALARCAWTIRDYVLDPAGASR